MDGLTLEDYFVEQSKRLEQLKITTTFIQNKKDITDDLKSLQSVVNDLQNSLDTTRDDIEKMKNQNESMKRLSKALDKLKTGINHMESNIPPKLLRDYAKIQIDESKNFDSKFKDDTPNCRKSEGELSDDVFDDYKENTVKNCKKMLFNETSKPFPTIKLLCKNEFDNIPKYMIGRQSLDTVNQFLATINEILKAKYTLLALGMNAARKRGEFDLYMSYKKQENTGGKEKGKLYFFTAEDYNRHTKTKLDKTKLNLLTVLRHCKRLREVRAAKAIQYTVIQST